MSDVSFILLANLSIYSGSSICVDPMFIQCMHVCVATYVCCIIVHWKYPQQVQYFNLTITPCPPGHVLHSTDEEDEYECQCNDDNDDNIVSCLPEESRIVLKVCLCINLQIFHAYA